MTVAWEPLQHEGLRFPRVLKALPPSLPGWAICHLPPQFSGLCPTLCFTHRPIINSASHSLLVRQGWGAGRGGGVGGGQGKQGVGLEPGLLFYCPLSLQLPPSMDKGFFSKTLLTRGCNHGEDTLGRNNHRTQCLKSFHALSIEGGSR